MWLVAKALHLSPFSPEVAVLSPSEFYWTLLNYHKDQQEDFDKVKLLARFINPEAAKKVFDESVVERTESTDSFMFEEMPKELKDKYSPEELESMLESPEHYQELDRIEKV